MGAVKAPIHKMMPLKILNDKDEVKNNGKNTGFCWTSERRERASFFVVLGGLHARSDN